MVGYERRITTDAMGKYYADKQSVQRIIYLAFIETFKVVETLFDIVKSKSKLREKTVERVISRNCCPLVYFEHFKEYVRFY